LNASSIPPKKDGVVEERKAGSMTSQGYASAEVMMRMHFEKETRELEAMHTIWALTVYKRLGKSGRLRLSGMR
jgi:hypothetical protein